MLEFTDEDFTARLDAILARERDRLLAGRQKYGESWCKRGGGEAYHNVTRKWDRIEQAVEQQLRSQDIFAAIDRNRAFDGTLDGKDSLLDDIGDLRRYLLLVEEKVTRPDGFQ